MNRIFAKFPREFQARRGNSLQTTPGGMMRAIVIEKFGGPEQLVIQKLPDPEPKSGQVLIEVKAFGVNHAETHMRKGEWPEPAKVSGIECAGVVKTDPDGHLAKGQKVVALMGGMGRTINGSYAELTCVPATNVVPVNTSLRWAELAALPESYATAWTCLCGNLELKAGQSVVIRGATSALGQAAVNIAADAGAQVVATTRNEGRFSKLEGFAGAACVVGRPRAFRPCSRGVATWCRCRRRLGGQQHGFRFAAHGEAGRTRLGGRMAGRIGSHRVV
jgi:NADPH:quinone reductase